MTESETEDLQSLANDELLSQLRFIYRGFRERGKPLVVEAYRRGIPVKEIREVTGLGHQRIYQILNLSSASTQPARREARPSVVIRSMEEEWDDAGRKEAPPV